MYKNTEKHQKTFNDLVRMYENDEISTLGMLKLGLNNWQMQELERAAEYGEEYFTSIADSVMKTEGNIQQYEQEESECPTQGLTMPAQP